MLSERNKRFAEAIVYSEASSITASYRETRDTTANVRNCRSEASRLWRSAPVQAYADVLRDELLNRARARVEGDRERIRLALWSEASAADRAADRLTALRLLGLSVNLFAADKSEIPTGAEAHSAAEIANQIETMLIELGPEVDQDLGGDLEPPTPLLPEKASQISKHQSTQPITNSARISTKPTTNSAQTDNVIQMHPTEGVYSPGDVESSAPDDFELLDSVKIFEVSPKKKKKNFEIPGMNPLKF